MKATCALALFTAVFLGALGAANADRGRPGHKGTVAAYFPTRATLLDSERCPRRGRAINYVACGSELRDRVKAQLCRTHGKGLHKYWYQIGDKRPNHISVYCKDGDVVAGDSADRGRPGHKGTVAAYFPDRGTLFDSERCPRRGLAVNYVACGNELRARLKVRLCRRRGKGLHKYWYQIGDKRPRETSVYCKG